MKLLRDKKSRAKSKGIEFTLKVSNVHFPKLCPVLGLRLDYSRGTKGYVRRNSPSFDRINPTKGYTPSNTIVVSHLANTIKNNATIEELVSVARFYQQLRR